MLCVSPAREKLIVPRDDDTRTKKTAKERIWWVNLFSNVLPTFATNNSSFVFYLQYWAIFCNFLWWCIRMSERFPSLLIENSHVSLSSSFWCRLTIHRISESDILQSLKNTFKVMHIKIKCLIHQNLLTINHLMF